ncbi:MAG: hypothetical protein IKU63_09115 [Bacteroidaceae bacterium]|nr:hypothetical protein [Bacteroidaceae bacterium]
MAINKMLKPLAAGTLLAGALALTACVDDSYDFGQDIDLTMQLGTEGLQVKLGNTEKIYMNNIIDLEDEENLETTTGGLYYLVEEGNSEFHFDVDNVSTQLDVAQLTPEIHAATFEQLMEAAGLSGITSVPSMPAITISTTGITAEAELDIHVDNVPDYVYNIKSIKPRNGRFHLWMEIIQTSLGKHFWFEEIKNLKIYVPDYVKCPTAVDGVVSIPDMTEKHKHEVDMGYIDIDFLEFAGEHGLEIKDGTFVIPGHVGMSCDATFSCDGGFPMQVGDFVNIRLHIEPGQDGVIYADEFTGIFNPELNPEISPIEIGNDLPEFLQDDEVRLTVANPTIRLDADLTQVPVIVDFGGTLTAYKEGTTPRVVNIPESGTAELHKSQRNLLYFFQGEEPFDPNGANAADLYRVGNLSSLLTVVPDRIGVDLSDGKVSVRHNELQTIGFGRSYAANLQYHIYVPFVFEEGLRIVYSDSITDLHKDLQDYQAKGVVITANILNTIPLDLTATIEPVGIDNKVIESIQVSPAVVNAGNAEGVLTPVEISITLNNPADLQKIDRLRFRITASASANDALTSQQYIQVQDLRLKLTGPVIADFNE